MGLLLSLAKSEAAVCDTSQRYTFMPHMSMSVKSAISALSGNSPWAVDTGWLGSSAWMAAEASRNVSYQTSIDPPNHSGWKLYSLPSSHKRMAGCDLNRLT